MPLTIDGIVDHVREDSKNAADRLRNEWIADCCNIVKNNREHLENACNELEELVSKEFLVLDVKNEVWDNVAVANGNHATIAPLCWLRT
jgi:hypothetical protein